MHSQIVSVWVSWGNNTPGGIGEGSFSLFLIIYEEHEVKTTGEKEKNIEKQTEK